MELIIYCNLSVQIKYDAVKVRKIPQYVIFFFFCNKYWKVNFLFSLFLDHENICIDTKFMVLQFLVFEKLTRVGFFSYGDTNLHFSGFVINFRQLV